MNSHRMASQCNWLPQCMLKLKWTIIHRRWWQAAIFLYQMCKVTQNQLYFHWEKQVRPLAIGHMVYRLVLSKRLKININGHASIFYTNQYFFFVVAAVAIILVWSNETYTNLGANDCWKENEWTVSWRVLPNEWWWSIGFNSINY